MGFDDAAIAHGGNLAAATATFGVPSGGWVDLSTGINPRAYPVSSLDLNGFARLPDAGRMERLREAAWRAYGAGERAAVVLAPGTQALIERIPQIGAGRARTAIVSPTYAEHARCWRRDHHTVLEVSSLPDAEDFDVVVLANPNNPDGRLFAKSDLMALADDLGMDGGLMVVDEAFADVTPGRSLVGECGHRALLVLRSFGKFFGLAGLRLGFAFGPERITQRLEELLGPWPVSGPAIDIGIQALSDSVWIDETGRRLVEEARRLDTVLRDAGLSVAGGTSLFRLVEHPRAAALHHALAQEGIWTRAFDYDPNWLRFGLPENDRAYARLERALATVASEFNMRHEYAAD